MSSYLGPSLGSKLELTDDLTIKGVRVYDALLGLNSNFTNLSSSIVGQNLTLSGTANVSGSISTTNTGSIFSNNNLYGSINGFLLAARNSSVGINLSSTGIITMGNTTATTSTTTGALVVTGGVGIGGSLRVGGAVTASSLSILTAGVTVSGVSTFNNSINGYAISLTNGLTSTTGIFSSTVSATSFSGNLIDGTLSATMGTFSGAVSATSFTGNLVGGTISGTTGSFSGAVTTGALSATTGTFSGAVSATSFTGNHVGGTVSGTTGSFSGAVTTGALSATTGTFSGAVSATSFSGNHQGGSVSATSGSFTGTVVAANPTLSTELTTKNYTDTALALKSDKSYVDALSYLSSPSTVTFSQTTDSTSTTSGAVVISGGLGMAKNLTVGGTGSFTSFITCDRLSLNTTTPTNGSHAASKLYVDNISYITAGSGLTKTGSTLSINASQSFSGAVTTGALSATTGTFNGDVNINGFSRLNPGTTETYSLTASSRSVFSPSGTVLKLISDSNSVNGSTLIDFSVPNSSNASTGAYIGAIAGSTGNGPAAFVIGYRSASTSWTESVRVSSVNAVVTIWSTVDSSSSSTGSLLVSGGVGITKNLNVGQNISCAEPTGSTHVTTKNYVDNSISSALVNGFLFFVTTTHNGVSLSYVTQKSYWHKIGLNLVCVQLCLQGITSAFPSASDSVYTFSLPGGMPTISNIINGQKPSGNCRIVGDTLAADRNWIAITSISTKNYYSSSRPIWCIAKFCDSRWKSRYLLDSFLSM